ncbi:YybS family protein [Halalkalibacillus sediminis]|nr:YybS family protein [Halalkalibacillus sediminis]
MNQSKQLTEGAVFAAIFIVILTMTFFIPLSKIVTIFLLPVPFVIYTARHGWKPAVIVFIVAMLIGAILLSVVSIPFTLFMGLGGIAIGSAINEQRKAYETWARGTLGFTLGLALIYVFTQFFLNINWMEEIRRALERSFETLQVLFEQVGQTVDEETLEIVRDQMESFVYLIPTGIVIIGVAFAFITQWISYRILNRLHKEKNSFPPFKDFRLPTSIIWIYFAGIILTWIYTEPTDSLYLVATNVYTLAGLLIVIQGLSFAFFFTNYKKWSKAIPITLTVLFVLFPFLLLYPFRILGIIDLGFQLRDRLVSKK